MRSTHGSRARERRALGVACGAHALHDGYTDLIYVLLPIWQGEFGLGYAETGLLRGAYAGAMAAFQIPAGLLAERLGTAVVLAGGTALAGLAFLLTGAVGGFVTLIALLIAGGLGASVQHPVASAVVSQAYKGTRSRIALGNYNFSGDVGKMLFPAMTALLLTVQPWRPALSILGMVGILAATAIFVLTPRRTQTAPAQGKHFTLRRQDSAVKRRVNSAPPRRGFPLLLAIGVVDSATRMAFLTFLPFVLTAKGASLPAVGFALALVFAGGAAGKLVCAHLGARLGVLATVIVTEGLTALGIAALLFLPLSAGLVLLPFVGIALNGTSSVLYGSVPELVSPASRARAFGLFYTGTIGAGAAAPALYGLFSDHYGVPATVLCIAAAVLLTIPLAAALKPALPRPSR